MHFMVIERFKHCEARAIYQQLRDLGRFITRELNCVSSWIGASEVDPTFRNGARIAARG